MPSPSTLTNTVEKEMQDCGQASLSVQQQCSAAEVERRAIAMLFKRNMIFTKLGNMECVKPTNTAAPPEQLRSVPPTAAFSSNLFCRQQFLDQICSADSSFQMKSVPPTAVFRPNSEPPTAVFRRLGLIWCSNYHFEANFL